MPLGPEPLLASLTAWEACHYLETADTALDVIFISVSIYSVKLCSFNVEEN